MDWLQRCFGRNSIEHDDAGDGLLEMRECAVDRVAQARANLLNGNFGHAARAKCLHPRVVGNTGIVVGFTPSLDGLSWALDCFNLITHESWIAAREIDPLEPDDHFLIGNLGQDRWLCVIVRAARGMREVRPLFNREVLRNYTWCDEAKVDRWIDSNRWSRKIGERAETWSWGPNGRLPAEMPKSLDDLPVRRQRGTLFTCKKRSITIWRSPPDGDTPVKVAKFPLPENIKTNGHTRLAYGKDSKGFPRVWVVGQRHVTMLSPPDDDEVSRE
jgi:hypothetical protein